MVLPISWPYSPGVGLNPARRLSRPRVGICALDGTQASVTNHALGYFVLGASLFSGTADESTATLATLSRNKEGRQLPGARALLLGVDYAISHDSQRPKGFEAGEFQRAKPLGGLKRFRQRCGHGYAITGAAFLVFHGFRKQAANVRFALAWEGCCQKGSVACQRGRVRFGNGRCDSLGSVKCGGCVHR